jgi:peroxiredoxin
MAEKLNTGTAFPKMSLNLVDGSSIDLPEGLGGRYNVILFYRGHW